MEVETFLALGSNIENRLLYLKKAIHHIENEIGDITAISPVFETIPWGFESNGNFYNAVVLVKTNLLPVELLNAAQSIEKKLGRTEKSDNQYHDRTIDIDILYYDNLHVHVSSDRLTIPHPCIAKRKFVLFPLSEIVTTLQHPLQREIESLLKNCEDKSPDPKKLSVYLT